MGERRKKRQWRWRGREGEERCPRPSLDGEKSSLGFLLDAPPPYQHRRNETPSLSSPSAATVVVVLQPRPGPRKSGGGCRCTSLTAFFPQTWLCSTAAFPPLLSSLLSADTLSHQDLHFFHWFQGGEEEGGLFWQRCPQMFMAQNKTGCGVALGSLSLFPFYPTTGFPPLGPSSSFRLVSVSSALVMREDFAFCMQRIKGEASSPITLELKYV